MNKRQKNVQQQFIGNEQAVIKRLKQIYAQSLEDIERKCKALQDQISSLQVAIDAAKDDESKAVLKSMQQSKIYQKQYQDALKKQISSILDNMQVSQFTTVADYLQQCYEDGFVGAMYDLQGQGIPLCMPLDQEAMVTAVQTDSKISEGLYSRLGEDVATLKGRITSEISRGIATGASFHQIAQQLAAFTNIGYNNAIRIARTEGHRIQIQGAMDACYKAQDVGAKVVKQWDSSLDKRVRPSHAKVDGEIRELDDPFSNGLMYPGDPEGGAAEVVNCRCALLQRAKWALDEEELKTLKERAAYFGLDKAESFEDYKKKYLKAAVQKTEYMFGDCPEEVAAVYKDTFEKLTKLYPLKKHVISAIGDVFEIRGWDKDWDRDQFLREDILVQKLGHNFTAQYVPPGTKILPNKGAFIEIGDFEFVSTTPLKKEFVQMRARRAQNGAPKTLADCTWNAGYGVEAVLTHEYGHALAYDLRMYKSMENIDALMTVFEKYDKLEIASQVSRYATSSVDEFFAECFVKSFDDPEHQGTIVKEVMGVLERIMEGQGRVVK